MANTGRKTLYVIQAFREGKVAGSYVPERPTLMDSESAALKTGARLAATKLGVLVSAQTADVEMGDYDEPVVLARHGIVPDLA